MSRRTCKILYLFVDRVHHMGSADLAQHEMVCATPKRDGLSMTPHYSLPLPDCTGIEGQPLQVSGTRHRGIVHGGQENKRGKQCARNSSSIIPPAG